MDGGNEIDIDDMKSKADGLIERTIQQLIRCRCHVGEAYKKSLISFESKEADALSKIGDEVLINLRGEIFSIRKNDILKFNSSLLYATISSPTGVLMKGDDGAYFFDTRGESFERIIDYLNTGIFSCRGLNEYQEGSVRDNLQFFRITLKASKFDNYISLKVINAVETALTFPPGSVDWVYGSRGNALIAFNMNGDNRNLANESSEIVLVLQVSNFEILSFTNDNYVKLWGLDNHGETKIIKTLLNDGDQVVCGVEVQVRKEYDDVKVFCFGTVTGRVEICAIKPHSNLIEMWWTLSEGSQSFPGEIFCTIIEGANYICAGSTHGQIKFWTKPILVDNERSIIQHFQSYKWVKHYKGNKSVTKIIPLGNDMVVSCRSGCSEIAVFTRASITREFELKSKFETRSSKQVTDEVNMPIIDMIELRSADGDICFLVGNDTEMSIVIVSHWHNYETFHRKISVSIDTGGILFPFSRCSLLEVITGNCLLLSYRRQFKYESGTLSSEGHLSVQNGGQGGVFRLQSRSFPSSGNIVDLFPLKICYLSRPQSFEDVVFELN
jgi:hypothetical protein